MRCTLASPIPVLGNSRANAKLSKALAEATLTANGALAGSVLEIVNGIVIVTSPEFSVRMFHLGREAWFNLETGKSVGRRREGSGHLSLARCRRLGRDARETQT